MIKLHNKNKMHCGMTENNKKSRAVTLLPF